MIHDEANANSNTVNTRETPGLVIAYSVEEENSPKPSLIDKAKEKIAYLKGSQGKEDEGLSEPSLIQKVKVKLSTKEGDAKEGQEPMLSYELAATAKSGEGAIPVVKQG